MKNYMVTHTFKSKEAKAKMGEVVSSMKIEDIVKSMTGATKIAKIARWGVSHIQSDNMVISKVFKILKV